MWGTTWKFRRFLRIHVCCHFLTKIKASIQIGSFGCEECITMLDREARKVEQAGGKERERETKRQSGKKVPAKFPGEAELGKVNTAGTGLLWILLPSLRSAMEEIFTGEIREQEIIRNEKEYLRCLVTWQGDPWTKYCSHWVTMQISAGAGWIVRFWTAAYMFVQIISPNILSVSVACDGVLRICLQHRDLSSTPKSKKIPWRTEIWSPRPVFIWRIPWQEEPYRSSMGSQRLGHYWVTNVFTFFSM